MEKTTDRYYSVSYATENSATELNQPLSGKEWKNKRFSEEYGFSFWLCVHPIKSYIGYDLPNDIGDSDIGKLFKLAKLLQKDTNLIVRHYENYDKPMNDEMIAKVLNINTLVCKRFLRRMIRKRIMYKDDIGHFYINPIYFFRGQYLSWHLYNIFQEDLDCVLPQWVIDRFNGDINA